MIDILRIIADVIVLVAALGIVIAFSLATWCVVIDRSEIGGDR